ncbi:transforming growth factor-beta receptor-associated protein 1 isoform X1 [Acipenser ruthenus]|uniref:transforming growth factor-beta receptor-associated protein 1 isoform X1 n=1 Tax=Acipenser ruthenus TaxID=7906 RepID=UPI00145BC2E5|nr:transforming growth factor-beta receptor-associated protein 1 isoform X1 [Acipenser ruthenus]
MSLDVFSLTLAIENQPAGNEKDELHFCCLESCGKNLYVGTKDCFVHHFVLPDLSQPGNEKTCPQQKEVKKRHLGMKRPITQLKASPILTHLLVLSDSSVTVLNMFSLEPIQTMQKIRNVALFEVNEIAAFTDPVFVELFVVASKKKAISIYAVSIDKWERVKEVPFPEEPLALAVDRSCLCVAMSDRYILHKHTSGTTKELFPYDKVKQNPIVKVVGRGEFLLNGPGSLGMFVTNCGISQRPPLQWPEQVHMAAVYFPYVVTLDSEALRVYSILDQQQKQLIPFQKGCILVSSQERVFVLTSNEIYSLIPVQIEEQIETLMSRERASEALDLVKGARAVIPKDKYKAVYQYVLQQAGFIKFFQECFSEAKELFIKGHLDLREVIALYPDSPPLSTTFKQPHPSVCNIKDLNQMKKEDPERLQRYKQFLVDFLSAIRLTEQAQRCKEQVDNTLLKLYAESGSEELIHLLSSDNACQLNECVHCLEKHQRYFALGFLYHSRDQDYNAIQTWIQIADGYLQESTQKDIHRHIVKFLSFQQKRELVWKYADWAVQKNQEVGVQIFTKRPQREQESFSYEEVIGFLKQYQLALMLYLEYLVTARNSKEERHHTLLAMSYLEQLLEKKDRDKITLFGTRTKLQVLLHESSFYNVAVIQDRVLDTELHTEIAILYSKQGEHDKALWTLVHKEQDFQAAERYCQRNSEGKDKAFRSMLFSTLLKIYLDSTTCNKNEQVTAAVDLLNNNVAVFDLISVLQILPDSWSLQLVSRFLVESVRISIHYRRMESVEKSLAQAEHLRYRYSRAKATEGIVKVAKERTCQVCHKSFTEPTFLWSLSGILTHTHCARR